MRDKLFLLSPPLLSTFVPAPIDSAPLFGIEALCAIKSTSTEDGNKMADETTDGGKVCANPPCSCTVEKGEKYCSVHCQSTGNTVQIDCDCGHPDCTGDF